MLQGYLYIMKYLLLILFFISSVLYSQQFTSIETLNKFKYGDHISLLDSLNYPLLQSGNDNNGGFFKAFLLDEQSGTYIVFRFTEFRKEYIYGIQITGYGKNIPLIENLYLGDTKNKVFNLLGNPSDSSEVKSVSTTLFTFDNRNYSCEIDTNNILYSFALLGDDGLLEKNEWTDNWQNYRPSSIELETNNFLESDNEFIDDSITLFANPIRFRPRVKYTGRKRPISNETKEIIDYWAKTNSQVEFSKLFTMEIEISENSKTYWIPIQELLLPDLEKYSDNGKRPFDLFSLGIGLKGNNLTLLANEFVIW
jgi:hypothetical protein